MRELKPIKLIPVFKDYIWGGNRLAKSYNQTIMNNIMLNTLMLKSSKKSI